VTNSNPLADSPPLASSLTAAQAAVPEPSGLFLVAFGALVVGLASYRRVATTTLLWKNRAPRP
jgi:hypothetical protein